MQSNFVEAWPHKRLYTKLVELSTHGGFHIHLVNIRPILPSKAILYNFRTILAISVILAFLSMFTLFHRVSSKKNNLNLN